MLDNYFCAPKTLRRLRAGPSAPYIDGFAESLACDGYACASAVRYLRAAAHLGCFVHLKRVTWVDVDADTLEAFGRHFRCTVRDRTAERRGITRASARSCSVDTWFDSESARAL